MATFSELLQLNGCRCIIGLCGDRVEGEIAVEDGEVFVLHNNPEYDGNCASDMRYYSYSWQVYTDSTNLVTVCDLNDKPKV